MTRIQGRKAASISNYSKLRSDLICGLADNSGQPRVRDHWGGHYPLFKSHYSETGHPFNQQPLLICSPRRLCLTARPVASFLCVKLDFHESHSSQPISCALVHGGRIIFWWSDSILYFFWEAESSHLPSWRHWYQVFDYHDHINKVSLLMTLWNLTTSTMHKEPPLIRDHPLWLVEAYYINYQPP